LDFFVDRTANADYYSVTERFCGLEISGAFGVPFWFLLDFLLGVRAWHFQAD